MIKFITPSWEWDLTNYGLTFNEDNPYFTEKQSKSYSFPISVELNEDVSYKLGVIHLEGTTDYKSRIYGKLFIDHEFYNGYISVNAIIGDIAEITFFYGNETLQVFDKNIRKLPYGITEGFSDLSHAIVRLSFAWPFVTHQFVKVFRDGLSSKANYKFFEGFLNNFQYVSSIDSWSFVQNTNEDIDGTITPINRNIAAPMTYMLEVLKVGFKSEGLELRGALVNNEFFKRVLLVPKNYMEEFESTQFLNYSFDYYTSQAQLDGQIINIYSQVHSPQNIGSYTLEMRMNFNEVIASYFQFRVLKDGITLFQSSRFNSAIDIEKTLNINILDNTELTDITVELRLVQQQTDISPFNSFKFRYKAGQLNVFPELYNIGDYLPNLKFREYYNRIKSWLNLKETYTDNAVYIDFIEAALPDTNYIDRSHLEASRPRRTLETNNLFKLSYPNKDTVYCDRNGQTFNAEDYTESETSPVDWEVLPLEVTDNLGTITAVYPEDEEDIMLLLYNGRVNGVGDNLAVNTFENQTFTAQDVFDRFWKTWLTFRANAETVKDSFLLHYTEAINITEGEYKYNTRRLIVSIQKKRISNEYYDIEMIAETF